MRPYRFVFCVRTLPAMVLAVPLAVGVLIGIDESSSRARISRYELGVHEPAVPTAKLIADALEVPLAHLYCEDDGIAELLLALNRLPTRERAERVEQFAQVLAAGSM